MGRKSGEFMRRVQIVRGNGVGVAALAVALGSGSLIACNSKAPGSAELLGATSAAVTSPSANLVPCAGRAVAVTANTGSVILNMGSKTDSYQASIGAYGGTNIGQAGSVRAATTITQNGGTASGSLMPNSPAHLSPVPVPAGAIKLPLGSSSPGSVNINGVADSLTLAPGSYVVANLNVNQPGSIKIQPAGKVQIWVTGTLNLGGAENSSGKPNDLSFFVSSSNFINLNGSGPVVASVYAPNAPINVSTAVFGTVVGGTVTLNTNGAVHFDEGLVCPSPAIASAPPRTLPAPPNAQGCYVGTANGWKAAPCTPDSSIRSEFGIPDPSIHSIPTPPSIPVAPPLQFGEVEVAFSAFGSETDSLSGTNSLSVQANTNYFNNSNNWVQLTVQTYGSPSTSPGTSICIWSFDIPAHKANPMGGFVRNCFGGGVGQFNLGARPGGYRPFDTATIGGSAYTDNTGAKVIGMVARVSWFDPARDPGNDRGLYAVVAPDTYNLAGDWTRIGGTVYGLGSKSNAAFTNSSVLTRVLAGTCANAVGPKPPIPWPGVCPTQPPLLPNAEYQSVPMTGETSNLLPVGAATTLAAYSPDLVYSQQLSSDTGACVAGSSRAFLRDSADDTGIVPSNAGGQPFWESPDIFLVPKGAIVDKDAIASETLLTPGQFYDVYVRVNNDFGCDSVTNVKSLIYLADPSALSTPWVTITNGTYATDGGHPAGLSVMPGQHDLLGPFSFQAPMTGPGNAHKCLLAAIQATNQPAPVNAFDAPASFQVAQRNIQLSDCKYPLNNATTTNGNLTLVLSAVGATPSTSGATDLEFSFDDPNSTWYNAWLPGAGAAYSVARSGTQTRVRLGQPSVTLAVVPLAAGQTITATGSIVIGSADPTTSLSISATLKGPTNNTLVQNGGTCQAAPLSEDPQPT